MFSVNVYTHGKSRFAGWPLFVKDNKSIKTLSKHVHLPGISAGVPTYQWTKGSVLARFALFTALPSFAGWSFFWRVSEKMEKKTRIRLTVREWAYEEEKRQKSGSATGQTIIIREAKCSAASHLSSTHSRTMDRLTRKKNQVILYYVCEEKREQKQWKVNRTLYSLDKKCLWFMRAFEHWEHSIVRSFFLYQRHFYSLSYSLDYFPSASQLKMWPKKSKKRAKAFSWSTCSFSRSRSLPLSLSFPSL